MIPCFWLEFFSFQNLLVQNLHFLKRSPWTCKDLSPPSTDYCILSFKNIIMYTIVIKYICHFLIVICIHLLLSFLSRTRNVYFSFMEQWYWLCCLKKRIYPKNIHWNNGLWLSIQNSCLAKSKELFWYFYNFLLKMDMLFP